MLKKVTKLLLILTLILQFITPVITVNAYEESDLEITETQVENDETAQDEAIEGESTTKEENDIAEEANDLVELNENLIQIRDIFPDLYLATEIAEKLELTVESYILHEDLGSITGFYLAEDRPDVTISSIEGLQYLINLERLILGEHEFSDITPLAGLIHLHYLELWGNQISDITPLAGLDNLTHLSLGGNQITDFRPLGNLNLNILFASDQSITLPTVNLGEGTRIEFFLPDGSRVDNLGSCLSFDYTDGILTWKYSGVRILSFSTEIFSATIYQEVIESVKRSPYFQAVIDAMRNFIENNSADNPFIIQAGLTFNEAINAFDQFEGVTVLTPGSFGETFDYAWMTILLQYEGEDDYIFPELKLFVQFEESSQTEKEIQPSIPLPQPPESRPNLPQTGSGVINTFAIGTIFLATGTTGAYFKKNKK